MYNHNILKHPSFSRPDPCVFFIFYNSISSLQGDLLEMLTQMWPLPSLNFPLGSL